jgi:ABC-2 type transport system ATP-binding protein
MAIRKSLGHFMIEIWTDDSRKALDIAKTLSGVKSANSYGDRLHIEITNRGFLEGILTTLENNAVTVRDSREILPSLEDIFISMIEDRESGENFQSE